ncbi:SigE family RNA polymerase sigma factor [Frankia sp. Mgl5]|uniref:RNA polymerase n=1 Tax=Parafrankia soli TaxID=2599596 RepID=A0A1S1R5X2_9ACTN|nr:MULTISPECIES: SigE family RNA polymerase sigma factor [Frankiaceae]ABW15150.1 RNA polymerase, sigma-24 subunit, ECF subfamily [Frankia sp. EAN1pec]MCK9932025.1 SigE family RNA polymerase sigma factor [Frankia sp. Mgl5]OHV40905.1 RNA polymerase [Parafrankia soli]
MDEASHESFEDFVTASADRLMRTAFLLTGNRHAAEDLLQGALERTYQRWGRERIIAPEAYVRRVLVNAASSRWRSRQFREEPLDAAAERAGADGMPDLAMRDQVLRALRELPKRQRAVVVLRYFDDLPEAAVAEILGCSVGSVKTHASRALARLRGSQHLGDVRVRIERRR